MLPPAGGCQALTRATARQVGTLASYLASVTAGGKVAGTALIKFPAGAQSFIYDPAVGAEAPLVRAAVSGVPPADSRAQAGTAATGTNSPNAGAQLSASAVACVVAALLSLVAFPAFFQ